MLLSTSITYLYFDSIFTQYKIKEINSQKKAENISIMVENIKEKEVIRIYKNQYVVRFYIFFAILLRK